MPFIRVVNVILFMLSRPPAYKDLPARVMESTTKLWKVTPSSDLVGAGLAGWRWSRHSQEEEGREEDEEQRRIL